MATQKFKNEARPNERQGQQSSVGRHVMKTQDIDEATFAEIMGRIHSITNTRTQVELAEFLGIGQSSISDAKKRRSIPSEWLLKLYWEKKVNPGWVIFGRGGKYLQQVILRRMFRQLYFKFGSARQKSVQHKSCLMNWSEDLAKAEHAAQKRREDRQALQGLSCSMQADALARRMAVARGIFCLLPGKDGLHPDQGVRRQR